MANDRANDRARKNRGWLDELIEHHADAAGGGDTGGAVSRNNASDQRTGGVWVAVPGHHRIQFGGSGQDQNCQHIRGGGWQGGQIL